jgi:hypothetical protein
MPHDAPTTRPADAFPAAELATAAAATRARLFAGLDVEEEARLLGVDRALFAVLERALVRTEEIALRVAAAEAARS